MSQQARIASARERPWSGSRLTKLRLSEMAYSFADQALSVGGMFLANIFLARAQSKEEYGLFALCYSIYLFLAGMHSAAVVEPYTVFGSGRYRGEGTAYLRLMARSNLLACVISGALLLAACGVLQALAPQKLPKGLLGMALAITFMLSGIFSRRAFYVQGKAAQAAKASLTFFVTVVAGLWLAGATHRLDGFTIFLILALGWIAALLGAAKQFPRGKEANGQAALAANYWREHWSYARWSLSTTFLGQLVVQGYYWLIAGLLLVRDVADLRAMTLLIAPAEQVLIALSYVVLPRLAMLDHSGQRQEFLGLWRLYTTAILGVASTFVLAVRLVALPVMHLVYAGKFDGLFPLLVMLAFVPLVSGAGHTINSALKAMERPKLVFYGYLSSGVVGVTAGPLLVARFGVRGAVYGMLLAGCAYTGTLGAGFLLALRQEANRQATPEGSLKDSRESSAVTVANVRSLASSETAENALAPIALFVYNREEHTRQTVESLRANDLAQQSNLYVFADAARNESAGAAVAAVRKLIRSIDGFKSVTVIERDRNFGLAASVINGVTQLCHEFGRVIVMEDDLLTAPDFLIFMNVALQHYADQSKVFSVSGFNFPVRPPQGYSCDAFLTYRSSSWGWGTWKDRWAKADWSISDFRRFNSDKQMQRLFNRGGEDLSRMLALQMAGRIDSWSIRWDYVHFKHNAVALYPLVSRIYNIGFDGSGIHCQRPNLPQSPLEALKKTNYRFPDTNEADPNFTLEIQKLHRVSLARKLAHHFKDRMELK